MPEDDEEGPLSAEVPPNPDAGWDGGGGARSTRCITFPPTSSTKTKKCHYICTLLFQNKRRNSFRN